MTSRCEDIAREGRWAQKKSRKNEPWTKETQCDICIFNADPHIKLRFLWVDFDLRTSFYKYFLHLTSDWFVSSNFLLDASFFFLALREAVAWPSCLLLWPLSVPRCHLRAASRTSRIAGIEGIKVIARALATQTRQKAKQKSTHNGRSAVSFCDIWVSCTWRICAEPLSTHKLEEASCTTTISITITISSAHYHLLKILARSLSFDIEHSVIILWMNGLGNVGTGVGMRTRMSMMTAPVAWTPRNLAEKQKERERARAPLDDLLGSWSLFLWPWLVGKFI